MPSSLPLPNAALQAQSETLLKLIQTRIRAEDGWLSFLDYMNMALYTPELGYYTSGAPLFGEAGDFVTAPELTPLFAQTLSTQVNEILSTGALKYVLEIGAGSGRMAVDLLQSLESKQALPERYYILELSAELKVRQQHTLKTCIPNLFDRVQWLNALPSQFEGLVLANEVLDAMPVALISHQNGQWFERGVGLNENDALSWVERAIPTHFQTALAPLPLHVSPDQTYLTELHLPAQAWVKDLARTLKKGVILFIDYGYSASQYYLPARNQGSLQCFYQHRVHNDPLLWPGLCDITSFVDFTAIAQAGYDAGLDVQGFTTQAQFLLNCGLLDCLAQQGDPDQIPYLKAARAVQRLIAPGDMGETFKVLILSKNYTAPLLGLQQGNKIELL